MKLRLFVVLFKIYGRKTTNAKHNYARKSSFSYHIKNDFKEKCKFHKQPNLRIFIQLGNYISLEDIGSKSYKELINLRIQRIDFIYYESL